MSWRIIAELRGLAAAEAGGWVKDWGGKIPIAAAYPNTYHVGMSNLGFLSVYGLLNRRADVVAERFFLPNPGLFKEMRRTNTPLLSLESQRPLTDFEWVAFSVSHENDYLHLVQMLIAAGLAPKAADRQENDPLIMAGGVCLRSNPAPIADFLDLVLIGDGEVIVPELVRAWGEARSFPLPKPDRVSHLARRAPGAFAPARYEAALDNEGRLQSFSPGPGPPDRVKVARAKRLPSPALASPVITADTEFSNTRLIEIGRGCPRGCRFCLAGFAYRPPRFAEVNDVVHAALQDPPVQRVGLVSPAVGDHPQLIEMIRRLAAEGLEVTVSSLRLESLTPELIDALALGRQKSAAVAPEAGSERLRRCINKNLTEAQIMEGVSLLGRAGLKKIKLYFMLGLPSETDQDAEAAVDLTVNIRRALIEAATGQRLKPEITVSLSSFVPKPFTPFQRLPMTKTADLRRRASIIKTGLKNAPGVKVFFDNPKMAVLQTFLSRGDRRAGEVVLALAENKGNLNQALKMTGVSADQAVYDGYRPEDVLPWDFIDHGFDPRFMGREQQRAADGKPTPACRVQACTYCGVCGEATGEA